MLMLLSLVSCSKSSTKQLSIEDYQDRINEISDKIDDAMSDADNTTPDGIKKYINIIEPLYEELSNLNAPDEFKDIQEIIKSGCKASLEILDLSRQILEDPSKAIELTEKIADLQSQVSDFGSALQEVIGR